MLIGAFFGGASVLYTLYICVKHGERPFYLLDKDTEEKAD